MSVSKEGEDVANGKCWRRRQVLQRDDSGTDTRPWQFSVSSLSASSFHTKLSSRNPRHQRRAGRQRLTRRHGQQDEQK